MGCFSGQKSKKRTGELQPKAALGTGSIPGELDGPDERENPGLIRSGPPSFRSKVKVIQNAQRFINGNPKLRSSHPGYGRSERDAYRGLAASVSPPVLPLGRRTHSVTEMGSAIFDVQAIASLSAEKRTFTGCPMPLPSPQPPSSKPNGYRLPRPQDLAVPSAPSTTSAHVSLSRSSSCKNSASSLIGFRSLSCKIHASDPQPLPPPPREAVADLRSFTYEELAAACNNFSPDRCVGEGRASLAYTGVVRSTDAKGGEKQLDVTVTRLCERWPQSYKEWLAELASLARLHGPHHLCKIIGYHAEEGSKERFLVYQRLPRGSLDRLLYGRVDSPPLDWPSRTKIALGAAQDLAYLHQRAPEPITYREFRTSHIDVDMDFSSKLSGYGFANCSIEDDNANYSVAEAYRAPETSIRGQYGSPKSNAWSFGVVLLELLTGRKNMDLQAPKEERNLVRWTRPFLMDEVRLFLIMDPKLQGRFPTRGTKMIAELAHKCLQRDSSRRPAMREAMEVVKLVQGMWYTTRFPLKEPAASWKLHESASFHESASSTEATTTNSSSAAAAAVAASSSSSSSSSAGMVVNPKLWTTNQDKTAAMAKRVVTKSDLIENPPLRPLIIPPRSCSCTFAMEEGMTRRPQYSSRVLGRLESF